MRSSREAKSRIDEARPRFAALICRSRMDEQRLKHLVSIRMVQAKPIIRGVFAALLIAACLAVTSQAASAQSGEPRGRAYLFRGLIGLIDWGMDELAGRIAKSGVQANIDSHLVWRSMADRAIADYRRDPKPISVVGHSAGGDAAVEFAEALGAAHVPVALLITYDPNRSAGTIPANVERYIDLYQSSNFLGGGDLAPGHGFHGHYAAFNLKDRPEIIHVNMDKFEGIQAQLAAKIRSAAAGGAGEAVPLRLVFPSTGPIELWDSGVAVQARAGDTVQSLAAAYHVPAWAVAQINQKAENASLSEGQRIVIPRMLGQRLAVRGEPAESGKPAPSAAPSSSPDGSSAAPASPAANSESAPAETSSSAPSQAASPEPSRAPSPVPVPAPALAPALAPSPAPSAASSPAPKPVPRAGSSSSQINQ
jgi:LysM repeat protein